MRHPVLFLVPLSFAALVACSESPTDTPVPAVTPPALTVIGGDNPNGAIILNKGEASGDQVGSCFFGSAETTDLTLVRNPSGGGLLSCHWDDFPVEDFGGPFPEAVGLRDFYCVLNWFGQSETYKSQIRVTPSGKANMHCTFDEVLD
jgi:hypothetical protein